MKKILKNQTEFRIERVIKRKGDKRFIKWEIMKIHLIVGLMK